MPEYIEALAAWAGMIDQVHAAVSEALNAYSETDDGSGALQSADVAAREQAATEREAAAKQLRKCADALVREAKALRAGGHVVYMENRYSSGFSDRTRHVRTASGRLLNAVPELPTVSGAARYTDAIERREED